MPAADTTPTPADRLIVYYDRSCPVCRTEIDALNLADRGCELRDCSLPGFADVDAQSSGVSTADMMTAMHVRDADGRWITGVDALAALYQRAGRARVARLLRQPLLRPCWNLAYRLFARNRQRLSRLGVQRPLGFLLRRN